jgi:DNA-binding TFAR19-related protein (PDSD5 family)
VSATPTPGPGPIGPLDACPYKRPFPDDFDDCPTYQGTLFVGLDLQYRPLRPSRSCRFLTVGELATTPGTFYARCALGGAAARERWIERLDRERLQKLQVLRLALAASLRPQIEELWRVKGDQLREQKQGEREWPDSTAALQAASGQVTSAMEQFLDQNSERLEELKLPRDAVVKATLISLEAFITQTTSEQGQLPEEVLAGFPKEVRALLRPTRSDPDLQE